MPLPPPDQDDHQFLTEFSKLVTWAMWLLALAGLVFCPWAVMILWEEGGYAPHPFMPLPALDPDIILFVGGVIGLAELARIWYDHGLLRLLHCANGYAVLVAYSVSEGMPLGLSLVVGVVMLLYLIFSSED